ncbi:MAG UNVERIFIED_CONTAM: hypothetical protein LVT10_13330 [Anaerolineae bacterium]|jgi:hypothetical protein
MDFIFGTLATDALKQVFHRALRMGIQHRHAMFPANPRPNEPVTLSAWVGTDCDVDALACYYTTNLDLPSGAAGASDNSQVARFHQVSTEWDTLAWGYLTRWEVTLPAQPNGTIVQYRIGDGARTTPRQRFLPMRQMQPRSPKMPRIITSSGKPGRCPHGMRQRAKNRSPTVSMRLRRHSGRATQSSIKCWSIGFTRATAWIGRRRRIIAS